MSYEELEAPDEMVLLLDQLETTDAFETQEYEEACWKGEHWGRVVCVFDSARKLRAARVNPTMAMRENARGGIDLLRVQVGLKAREHVA